jgi:rhodanese-related sulfurtransferase
MMLSRLTTTLAVTMVASTASLSAAAEHAKDSLSTVKKNVEAKKAVLVDVREKSEWDASHVKGAVLLPLSELQDDVDAGKLAKRLPKDKILYTHCVVGKRSVTAGSILERAGYQVRPLKAGYKELLRAGFPKADD